MIGNELNVKVDGAAIREHLARLLDSEGFRRSERSKQFLQFIVERTLEGRESELKERTIGIEVFGRAADYDPATDSIVRVKATEIRRRLAQYYDTCGDTESIHIDLPPGTYVPLFHNTHEAPSPALVLERADVDDTAPLPAVDAADSAKSSGKPKWIAVGTLVLAALSVAVVVPLLRSPAGPSGMDAFWQPVFDRQEQPILRLPESQLYVFRPEARRALDERASGEVRIHADEYRKVAGFHVSVPTFYAAMDIALFLQRRGRTPRMQPGSNLKPDELHRHPIIAVSSRPQEWAMGESSRVRFRIFPVEVGQVAAKWIQDSTDPGRSWRADGVFPFEAQTVDYGLITRVFDRANGNVAITVSGITSFGSQAAASFLTNPEGWSQMQVIAPADWEKKNLQIVLKTNLVGLTPSAAQVVAVHCW